MGYIPNPKMLGSGMLGCIPQKGRCPNECPECFFQSGRSYLEPLEDNLPNMPLAKDGMNRVIRVNDGNDSANNQAFVIEATKIYGMRFFNTCCPDRLKDYPGPVVVTVNPGKFTDKNFNLADLAFNLMAVRARVNTWNMMVVDRIVKHYSRHEVPIFLTFMAYFDTPIPKGHEKYYTFRKRTFNSYWAITTAGWEMVMSRYKYNKWVYSCGKIEGELGTTACRHCGNCLREYFATMARIRSTE